MLAKKDRTEDHSPVLPTEKGDAGQEAVRRSRRRHGEQRSQTTTLQRRVHHNQFPAAYNSRAPTEHYGHPARIHTLGQHSNGYYYGIGTAFNAYS
jgi:hypothetical protein